MPIFAVIDIESLVQEEDKTRIDVSKSYASGTTAITLMEVTPSKSADAIDVTADGFLDWQYDFTVEIDALNNKIDFSEGGAQLTATLATNEYTLTELAAEMQSKLRAAGALTYALSVSAANAITIAADDEFSLLVASGTNTAKNPLSVLGFVGDQLGAATYTGETVDRITKKITLTIENDDGSKTITREIEVVSELADNLFSTDDRMRKHESDVMRYLPEGRATFKDIHRRAQTLILAWLDTNGFIDNRGYKLTLARFTDVEEMTEWATMMALRILFESNKTAKDDIFSIKTKKYEGLEDFYRARATIKVDLNRDGVADALVERLDIRSCLVVRR